MRLVTNALAGRISQAMEDQGLSLTQAAAKSRVSIGLLGNILYGRSQRPKPETLQAVAKGLNIPYRELALAAYGIVHDPEPVPALTR